MKKRIILDGRTIVYDLARKEVKNINLRIKPDGSVNVSAHPRVDILTIEKFMRSKSKQILDALDKFEKRRQNQREPYKTHTYKNGDCFWVFGLQYELNVIQGNKNSVELTDLKIILTVKDVNDIALKKRVMKKWLTDLCKTEVLSIINDVYPLFEKRGVAYPQIVFRAMVSRWGSCHYKLGRLTFNTALVGAPKECIRYVVFHEFTHFIHPDHSAGFHNELRSYVPDADELKEQLNYTPIYRD